MPSKKRKPQAKSSSWKPWGDHPRVVAISIISGLGGLVVGLISLWYTINNHSVQQATQTTKSTPSVSAPSSSVQQLPQPKSNPPISSVPNSVEELPPQSEPAVSATPDVYQQPVARQADVPEVSVKQQSKPSNASKPGLVPSSQTITGDYNNQLIGNGNILGDKNVREEDRNRNNLPSSQPLPSSQTIEGNGNTQISGHGNVVGNGNRSQ